MNSKTLILEIVLTKECIVDINGGCMQFMPNQTKKNYRRHRHQTRVAEDDAAETLQSVEIRRRVVFPGDVVGENMGSTNWIL